MIYRLIIEALKELNNAYIDLEKIERATESDEERGNVLQMQNDISLVIEDLEKMRDKYL